jgi:hypothetical protein
MAVLMELHQFSVFFKFGVGMTQRFGEKDAVAL